MRKSIRGFMRRPGRQRLRIFIISSRRARWCAKRKRLETITGSVEDARLKYKSFAAHEVFFPPPCGEGCLSEAKTGWGLREGCTPPLAPPHKGEGNKILLDIIPSIG